MIIWLVSRTKGEAALDEMAQVELKYERGVGPRLEVHVAVVALARWPGRTCPPPPCSAQLEPSHMSGCGCGGLLITTQGNAFKLERDEWLDQGGGCGECVRVHWYTTSER